MRSGVVEVVTLFSGRLFVAALLLVSAWDANAAGVAIDLAPDEPGIQPEREAVAGEVFDADIWATDVLNLDTYSVTVGYDPRLLESLNITRGPFLQSAGATAFFFSDTDNTAGKANGSESIAGSDPNEAPDGSGVLFTIQLKAVRPGVAALTFIDVAGWRTLFQYSDGGTSVPTFVPASITTPGVVINEILYQPAGDPTDQCVELYAVAGTVELEGWQLSDEDGNWIALPNLTVSAGEYVVVHAGAGTDELNASPYVVNGGKTTGVWAEAGDDVTLLDAAGVGHDYVAFGSGGEIDAPPSGLDWHPGAGNPDNGAAAGTSISLIPNGTDADRAGGWEASGADESVGPSTLGMPNSGPTAVRVHSLTAVTIGTHVLFTWATGIETGIAGFNVYWWRRGASPIRLNTKLIPARGPVITGRAYDCACTVAGGGGQFALEIVATDGTVERVWFERGRMPRPCSSGRPNWRATERTMASIRRPGHLQANCRDSTHD